MAFAGLKNAEAQLNSLSKKLPPAGGSQSLKPIAAIPDAAPGAEIPFVFPDKVQGTRYLVELEADSEGAGDLAGDAGAVGRFTLAGTTHSIARNKRLYYSICGLYIYKVIFYKVEW